jgi:hypothetical protein
MDSQDESDRPDDRRGLPSHDGTATVRLVLSGAVEPIFVGLGYGCSRARPARVAAILPVAVRRDRTMDPAGG